MWSTNLEPSNILSFCFVSLHSQLCVLVSFAVKFKFLIMWKSRYIRNTKLPDTGGIISSGSCNFSFFSTHVSILYTCTEPHARIYLPPQSIVPDYFVAYCIPALLGRIVTALITIQSVSKINYKLPSSRLTQWLVWILQVASMYFSISRRSLFIIILVGLYDLSSKSGWCQSRELHLSTSYDCTIASCSREVI